MVRDKELYSHLLGIQPPWRVTRVEMNVAEQRIDVWVEHAKATTWPCSECGERSGTYDHGDERAWRHLDSCGFKTFLHARPPRVKCAEHGVLQVKLPWAEPHARFTLMFEHFAIDVLEGANVQDAARVLDLSWDEASLIQNRAVARGLRARVALPIKRLSVDEKAIAKGHTYLTIVSDVDAGVVLHVAEGRTKASLDSFYETLTEQQLAGIEAVAMDMWPAYASSTLQHVPEAEKKIVYDRFHIMKHMNEAVDKVRRQENRLLSRRGDASLKGSKQLWLYGEESLPIKHQERFAALRAMNLRTAKAWALKEALRGLWEYRSPWWALLYWKWWYHWVCCNGLAPVREVARMMKDHLANVLSFTRLRVTTATSEGLNSKIGLVKKRAYGFRNVESFKTAIMFHCGGLALRPVLPESRLS